MLINADIISGFDDAAGLQRFLDKAAQLESNFVAMSDVSLAQEKKELAKSKAIYDEKAEGLDRGMAKLEELSKAKWKELTLL